MAAAGESRNPVRDRLLILTGFRHALRVSELVDIRWQQVHLDSATIDIRRAKNGTPGIHGLQGDELRLLRALRREHPHADFVFLSERKAPLSVDGALIERLGEAATLPFPIHAHMLRHAASYALAGRGVDTRTLQAWRLPTRCNSIPRKNLRPLANENEKDSVGIFVICAEKG